MHGNDPRGGFTWLLFSLLLTLATSIAGCSKYDELVKKDQVAQERWANVEAQLSRRHDLIPNLVATVKAAAQHEEETVRQVIEARARATSIQLTAEDLREPARMEAFKRAQDELRGALSRLLMVQERYPDLKANQGFLDIQLQLEGTENQILRARELYNAAVSDYNAALQKVGGMAINKVTGRPFKPRVYFTASSVTRTPPTVFDR